jgi:hypothetical protein
VVPLVVRRSQLVGHLLLLRREARVERLERPEKTRFVLGAHLRELLAQRKTLDEAQPLAVLLAAGFPLRLGRAKAGPG